MLYYASWFLVYSNFILLGTVWCTVFVMVIRWNSVLKVIVRIQHKLKIKQNNHLFCEFANIAGNKMMSYNHYIQIGNWTSMCTDRVPQVWSLKVAPPLNPFSHVSQFSFFLSYAFLYAQTICADCAIIFTYLTLRSMSCLLKKLNVIERFIYQYNTASFLCSFSSFYCCCFHQYQTLTSTASCRWFSGARAPRLAQSASLTLPSRAGGRCVIL